MPQETEDVRHYKLYLFRFILVQPEDAVGLKIFGGNLICLLIDLLINARYQVLRNIVLY